MIFYYRNDWNFTIEFGPDLYWGDDPPDEKDKIPAKPKYMYVMPVMLIILLLMLIMLIAALCTTNILVRD
jgi:hypothetical protein